jgi:hypothetical protein
MFGKKSDSKPQGRIDSLIGAGTRVEGSLYFTGGLRIDGEVKGSVQAAEGASSSTLVLSEQARIEGGGGGCPSRHQRNRRRPGRRYRDPGNAAQGAHRRRRGVRLH